MASRANKEERQPPAFGAPMSTPAPSPSRDSERKAKLETKATDEERRKLIEEHETRGRAENAGAANDTVTDAPKPKPYETVRQPGGGTPAEIIEERPSDVMDAIDRAEGVEPVRVTEPPPAALRTDTPRRPRREPPKRK